ncbi:hypothetical protein ACJJTC_019666 [Scirpophaga incertulas]
MLKKLDLQNNELSNNLARALRKRIKERRLPISGMLQYLHDPESFFSNNDDDDCDIFAKPTSDEIHQTIVNLLKRLNYNNEKSNMQGGSMAIVTEEPSTSMSSINTSVEDEDDSFHKQLDKEISKASKPSNIATSAIATDLESIIRVEMCVFETGGGGREVFLSAAYKYLQSVTEKL